MAKTKEKKKNNRILSIEELSCQTNHRPNNKPMWDVAGMCMY